MMPDATVRNDKHHQTHGGTSMLYFLLEIIIIVYGLLLAVKPDFWWKVTNKNPNQTPPHSYLRNTRIMGVIFAALGVILLLLTLI